MLKLYKNSKSENKMILEAFEEVGQEMREEIDEYFKDFEYKIKIKEKECYIMI